jgi:glycosyltransferase involved in cell wall biosynthesis
MLYQHGALSRLYTDFCIKGGMGRTASALLGRLNTSAAGKLRRRTVEGIPPSIVFSAPMVNVRSALTHSATLNERYQLENELFGRQMIRWGTGDANVVYSMYGSGLPFLRYAKKYGVKVVVDVFCQPQHHLVGALEHQAFPDWEDVPCETDLHCSMFDQYTREIIEVADLLLCPSPIVLENLQTFAKTCAPPIPSLPRAIVVPYGVPSMKTRKSSSPVPGRVLFAGGAVLLKGIHYLAMAAESLMGAERAYEFRVAGQASARVRQHPTAAALTFLGHLSREQMQEEYSRADVFVLPTLAEGSAGVVYEALAAGLPVVTTRSAGSVITHGKEGFIVPERDVDALAAAIETIARDRGSRNAMAERALATAANFGEEAWGHRVVEALTTLTSGA